MFSLPQPIPDNSRTLIVAEVEIDEVTDPPDALDITLRMVYRFTPPSFGGNINALVECLTLPFEFMLSSFDSDDPSAP